MSAQWMFRGSVERRHTQFSHAPHISLLGPNASCETCHVLDEEADYGAYFEDTEREVNDFVSNFMTINKDTCDECHQRGIVRSQCQLCHKYHRNPSFKVHFQQQRTAQR